MSRITSVKPQIKNPKRFNIFLDGEFIFGADEDLVVDYRLIPGKIIDTPLLEKLLKETEVGKLMERLYGLFNIRQRSEREVRNYLKRLSFKRKIKDQEELSEIVIDAVIDKLIKKGMIDDLQFARAWMEARSKKKGAIAIKGELIQKGINREIIEQVLQEDGSSEEEVAVKVLEKKLKNWQTLPYLEKKKKAYEFLMRRGFEYKVIRIAIENLVKKG